VHASRYPFVLSALVLAATAVGCSLVLDANEPQCKVDGDCANRGAPAARCVASLCVFDANVGGAGGAAGQGGEAGDSGAGGESGAAGSAPVDPKWACRGQLPTPVGETSTIHVLLPLQDFISQEPRAGVTVHVCGRLDVTCATPVSAPVVTDEKGVATLTIPAQPAFDGFFQLDATDTVAASLVFAQPLAVTEGQRLTPVNTFVLAQYRALVEAGGNVWNEARGQLFVESRNCDDEPAAGVTYSIPKLEADTVRVFLRDGAPDRNAPDTDATGIGGFILAGEGFHTVTGTLSVDGSLVNERRVFVRPGTFSYTVMSPLPLPIPQSRRCLRCRKGRPVSQPFLSSEASSPGKYRRIARLGEGGMANVWLVATHGPGGFSKLLVQKELKPDLVADEEFLVMFLDEARLAARLAHPNIVQTFEVGADAGAPYLVMEWLDGQPLHLILGRLKRPNVPLGVQVYILSKVCRGLHYAHDSADFDGTAFHIVHRDVSPQNVFVCYDGTVKVVDFGIAKASNIISQTRAGLVKGKIGYMAPEQAIGGLIDRRADVFAVGVMLWEAMAGKRLTSGIDKELVLQHRIEGRRQLVREVAPDAPALLADAADRAMEFAAADRFASAAELGDVLDQWLRENPISEREVSEFLTRSFAEERRRIRQVIDEAMQKVKSDSDGSLPASLRSSQLPLLTELSAISMSGSSLPVPSETALTQTASQPHIIAGPPAKGSTALVAVISILALALALVVGMLVRPRFAPTAATDAPSETAAATAAGGAPPVASASASQTATVGQAEVRIQVDQADAEATLDDARISLPFRASYPKKATPMRLRVTAPGFQPEERLIVPERDLAVEIALKPSAATGTAAATGGSRAKSKAGAKATGDEATGLGKKSKPTGPQRPIEESVY
jgi:eukaryotic-like serine/threonine-protein kinase